MFGDDMNKHDNERAMEGDRSSVDSHRDIDMNESILCLQEIYI